MQMLFWGEKSRFGHGGVQPEGRAVRRVISRVRFAEINEKPTDNLDAYESVLQYGAYISSNQGAPEHARVRDSLERADPSRSSRVGTGIS